MPESEGVGDRRVGLKDGEICRLPAAEADEVLKRGADKWEAGVVAAAEAHQVVTAEGVTNIETSSSTYSDMADMSVTITTSGGKVLLFFQATLSDTEDRVECKIIRDSIDIAGSAVRVSSGCWLPISVIAIDTPAAGTYMYKVQWRVWLGGPVHNYAGESLEHGRRLIAIELIS